MKALPVAPGASANSAGRIGADGCPPSVLLQSSKSSACAAVPLISAASIAPVRLSEPNTRLAPGPAEMARLRIRAAGSALPATVTPTVSRMPTLAQCTASPGRSSKRSAAERRASSSASCILVSLLYDASLFGLDAGGADHLAPSLRFVGDEPGEIGGGARNGRGLMRV